MCRPRKLCGRKFTVRLLQVQCSASQPEVAPPPSAFVVPIASFSYYHSVLVSLDIRWRAGTRYGNGSSAGRFGANFRVCSASCARLSAGRYGDRRAGLTDPDPRAAPHREGDHRVGMAEIDAGKHRLSEQRRLSADYLIQVFRRHP